jgi:hypothetical protein
MSAILAATATRPRLYPGEGSCGTAQMPSFSAKAGMKMADARHPAAATQPSYEIHELRDGDPPLDLGLRQTFPTYGEAVDFAFDVLQENDPLREGAVSALDIVRVDGELREPVWRYRQSDVRSLPGDLTKRWGFDVTRQWRGPDAHYRF